MLSAYGFDQNFDIVLIDLMLFCMLKKTAVDMIIEQSHDFGMIRNIIEEIKVAMLVTADDQLSMHARPMYTAAVDNQNNI